MKHNIPVTAILIGFFIVSQLIGLGLILLATPTGIPEPTVSEATQGATSILAGIAIGTIILLILIKFKLKSIWKIWYSLAVFGAMSAAFSVLIGDLLGMVLSAILTAWKMLRSNVIIHNITEIFVYSGIALLITLAFPITVWIAGILLFIVALYDAYAVWKSKHMVKMAEFQTESNVFAGLLVPYSTKTGKIEINTRKKAGKKLKVAFGHTAILGGGDVAFPLIYSATVFQWLMRLDYTQLLSYVLTMPVVICGALSLVILFALSEKNKFYPAIPFLAVGCYTGFAITWLLTLVV